RVGTLAGTGGFVEIEGWDVWRSFYFTLITTVGYSDEGLTHTGKKPSAPPHSSPEIDNSSCVSVKCTGTMFTSSGKMRQWQCRWEDVARLHRVRS
ncbi:MAG: hypothetical protein ACI835_004842, partial [Planctomycetota bacterium]